MITVRVPATIANLGPGFDTLGMALGMYNYISMAETDNGLIIEAQGDGAEKVPKDATNLVYKAADKVFQAVGYRPSGLKIKISNNIPMARGLGSSAAVTIGGMVAANQLSGCKLTNDQLLHMATCMEGHPDNVAPALLGGIVVSAQIDDSTVYRKISPPANLTTVVAIPDYELTTKKARDVLPVTVPLSDAVYNVSRASLLVWAFVHSDMELLGKAMDDKLHQPYRMHLVPGMGEVFQAAKDAGAYSLALGGAGPTLVAFCARDRVDAIGDAMKHTFAQHGVRCKIENLQPETDGVKILLSPKI